MAKPTEYQQEVDLLRGQVGLLSVEGVWTSKDPPKVSGIYGQLLQGLEAGDSLRRAFTRLHMASEANRTNAFQILTLVTDYRRELQSKAKQKGK